MSDNVYHVKSIPPDVPYWYAQRPGVGVFYGPSDLAGVAYDEDTADHFAHLSAAEGFYGFALDAEESLIEPEIFDLSNVDVSRGLRGQGIGTELVKLALLNAKHMGYAMARCEILNPRVVRIIERLQKLHVVRESHLVIVPSHLVYDAPLSSMRLSDIAPVTMPYAARFLVEQGLDEDGTNSQRDHHRLLGLLTL